MMPMVASMGGNAGTQTVAVAVRALAARELTPGNSGRIILREVITGLVNGAVFAVLLSSVALFWFQSVLLSVTIALAILLNLSVAGLAGILIPLTLKRLGQDPAVSSGVLVTFVTDMVGFVAFLGSCDPDYSLGLIRTGKGALQSSSLPALNLVQLSRRFLRLSRISA